MAKKKASPAQAKQRKKFSMGMKKCKGKTGKKFKDCRKKALSK